MGYDLEERSFNFAKDVASYVQRLPKGTVNSEYGKQLIRSSASVGANYIEANEGLSKKDFVMRVKIWHQSPSTKVQTATQAPKSKYQSPNKHQISNSKGVPIQHHRGTLRFGIWNLFGLWDLDFGASVL